MAGNRCLGLTSRRPGHRWTQALVTTRWTGGRTLRVHKPALLLGLVFHESIEKKLTFFPPVHFWQQLDQLDPRFFRGNSFHPTAFSSPLWIISVMAAAIVFDDSGRYPIIVDNNHIHTFTVDGTVCSICFVTSCINDICLDDLTQAHLTM